MTEYKYDKEIIERSENKLITLYNEGFVLTRKGVGVMQRVRSLRVNLKEFSLSSENRRILRKWNELTIEVNELPLVDYDWRIHAMGSKFYKERFGDDVMSANKIKSMVKEKSCSFNSILKFSNNNETLGYTICFVYDGTIHYAYPFYDTAYISKSLGIGMMTRTIEYFSSKGFSYIYLGSVYGRKALYKLQFSGEEWFDGTSWSKDLNILKKMLS